MLFFPSPLVFYVFFELSYCAFSGWGREGGLWEWVYLDSSWRRAPAPVLLGSARVQQRASAPAPARHVCAPCSAAPTPRSAARAPAIDSRNIVTYWNLGVIHDA